MPTLIVTTGQDQDGLERETQYDNIVDVLSTVAPDAEDAGVTLVVEPLNTAVDHPGYFLETSEEASRSSTTWLAERHTAVRHLPPADHRGNLIDTITDNVEKIGHFHIADVPGRHEPGTGELAYERILEAIDDTDYGGYVGCEFSPVGDADEAVANVLDWQ